MEKVLKVSDLRKLEKQVLLGQISYSRMVEIINYMAYEVYCKKNCQNKTDSDYNY